MNGQQILTFSWKVPTFGITRIVVACHHCRGGKYAEEEAKLIVVQILSVVSFCHLQGVVHRDLKPEVFVKFAFSSPFAGWKSHDLTLIYHDVQNFLFTSRNEDADMKLIDFGLSDFIRPGTGCSRA